MDRKRRPKTDSAVSAVSRLFFLALFFISGVILGQVAVHCVSDATGKELSDYLRDYLLTERTISADTLYSVFLVYFRYPAIAILLGFSAVGVILLPCLSVVFGFFLSFSVSCFTAAFGGDGVLLALSLSGLRCLITLPCYFFLATYAWGKSISLAALLLGRGRGPMIYGKHLLARLGICVLILLVGICMELLFVPRFLDLSLHRIFL